MVILPLDLSAASFGNRIIGEEWTTDTESSRLIYPINGCFYLKDLVVRNKASGAPLRPVVDFVLYELNTELSPTNPNVSYFLIHILNRGVQAVLLDYRAVGGQYQLTGAVAQELLSRYTLGGDGTFPFGNVTGVPVRLPPEMHDDNIQYAYDASMLTSVLNRIAEAVSTGDTLALEAVYNYIGDVSSDMLSVATGQIASLNNRISVAESTYLRQEGEYLITDNDENPAVRLGGFWQLNPDILLYGHGVTGAIGDLVPVATGTGVNARYVNIWKKAQDLGQVTFSLAASATSINEGGSVVFTLTTTGLSSGSRVPYRITGTAGFSSTDISPTPLTGFFTVNSSGIASLTVNAASDLLTEGTESFTLALSTGSTNVSRTVTINDTSRTPTISLSYSANSNGSGTITQVNEGQTAYLVITTQNITLPHDVTLQYSGSIVEGDLASARQTTVTVSTSPLIVPYSFLNDRVTEGNQDMVVSASSSLVTVPVALSLTVRDTSLSPAYSMYFSGSSNGSGAVSSRNEGQPFYLVFSATNSDAGENFTIQYGGTSTPADFSGTRAGNLTIGADGKAIVSYNTVLDNITDGNKTLEVSVFKDATLVATGTITIDDTSQNPVYNAFFSTANNGSNTVAQVNEGQVFYLFLSTTGIPSGTTFTVEYSGTANAADITDARPTSLTIGTNGIGSISYSSKNDFLSEGSETMIATIKSGTTIVATANVQIIDTSVSPTYVVNITSDTAGNNVISQATEGQTFYLNVTTTNVQPGTVLALTYSGNASGPDFTLNRATSATVNAQGRATVTYVLSNDFLLEGQETLTVTVSDAGNPVATRSINIVDTSVPVMYARYSLSSQGTGTITSVNEDQLFYLIINTRGYPQGKVFSTTCNLPFGGPDWETNLEPLQIGPLNANGESATLAFPIKLAKDYLTESNEVPTITIRDPNDPNFQVAVSIGINDTSKTPVINNYWASDSAGVNQISTAAPGSTAYLVSTTQNLSDGEVVGVSFNGSTLDFANLLNPPTTQNLTVVGNKAVLPVDLTLRNAGAKMRFQFNPGDSPEITNANEGQSVWLSFSDAGRASTNVYLAYSITNGGDIEQDFNDSTPGIVAAITLDGTGSFDWAYTVVADQQTEGEEILTVSLYEDAMRTVFIRSASLIINDTSVGNEIVINIPSSNEGVNLKGLFFNQMGRYPTDNDRVHFIIGNGVSVLNQQFSGRDAAIIVDIWPTNCKMRGTTLAGGRAVGYGGRGGGFVGAPASSYPGYANVSGDLISGFLPAEPGGACIQLGPETNPRMIWRNYGFMSSGGGGGGMIVQATVPSQYATLGIIQAPTLSVPAHIPRYLKVIGGGGGTPFGIGGGSGRYIAQSDTYDLFVVAGADGTATLPGQGTNVAALFGGIQNTNLTGLLLGCMPGVFPERARFPFTNSHVNNEGYVELPDGTKVFTHPFARAASPGVFYRTHTPGAAFPSNWQNRNVEVVNYGTGVSLGYFV